MILGLQNEKIMCSQFDHFSECAVLFIIKTKNIFFKERGMCQQKGQSGYHILPCKSPCIPESFFFVLFSRVEALVSDYDRMKCFTLFVMDK